MNLDDRLQDINSPSEIGDFIERGEDPFGLGGEPGIGVSGVAGFGELPTSNIMDNLNTVEGGGIATSSISIVEVDEKFQDVCVLCEKVPEKIMVCSRCRKVKYCGRDCQVKHWKVHKKTCKKKKTAKKK